MSQEAIKVGTITQINRYPVKSMAGEVLQSAMITPEGLAGDRRFAFVKEDHTRDGFPWFTGRDNLQMVRMQPQAASDGSITIQLPDGQQFPLTSHELQEQLTQGATRPTPIHLLTLDRGAYDGFPLSLIGEPTIAAVARRSATAPDARRFRPNFVVQPIEDGEGAEDGWVGGVITIGDRDDSPQLYIVKKDPRCMMINIDPDTAVQTPSVLKDVYRTREQTMGVYAVVLRPGEVKNGDSIYLRRL